MARIATDMKRMTPEAADTRCEIDAHPSPSKLNSRHLAFRRPSWDVWYDATLDHSMEIFMNSQSAARDSSAETATSVRLVTPPSSQSAPNPLWLIAAAMAFFFAVAAFFLAAD